MGIIDDAVHFLVYNLGSFLAVVLVLHPFTADEDFLAAFADGDGAYGIAHAPFADHPAGCAGGALNVVGCACGDIVKDKFLGNTAAKHDDQGIFQVFLAVAVPVFLRKLHGYAKCLSAGNNADLVDRIRIGQKPGAEGVAAFMVGRDALVLL